MSVGRGGLHLHGVRGQVFREGRDLVRGEADVRAADGATNKLAGGTERLPREESGLVPVELPKFYKIFQDFSSYRIFERMHETLNINKNKINYTV